MSKSKNELIRPSIGLNSNLQSEFLVSEDQNLSDKKKSSLEQTNENPFKIASKDLGDKNKSDLEKF